MALWSLFFLFLVITSCDSRREAERRCMLEDEVEQMEKCRLKGDNLGFYRHKYRAESVMDRPSVKYSLVLADYLVQTGNRKEAREVMHSLASDDRLSLNGDTLLWLDYLCHQGEVNYRPYNVRHNREGLLRGYDCLVQCYILSTRRGYSRYRGLSMKLLSRYLLNDSVFTLVNQNDPASIRYMNEEGVEEKMLAGSLAERALCEFLYLNDAYQTADAWRELAQCFFTIGNVERSVECLHMALANPAVDSIPALKANILQQMSMSYAALGDKYHSDRYRNEYLDIQESIRQDRQYEARAMELSSSVERIWYSVGGAFATFIFLCIVTLVLNKMRKKRECRRRAYDEEVENKEDELRVLMQKCSDARRAALRQRARMSMVTSMLPLIDRMRIATSKGNVDYALEVADNIVAQNEMLTRWIKLKQGEIMPRIETFRMQEVLDILMRNTGFLQRQHIITEVKQTGAVVRADKILTLFMLNTILDNARKAICEDSGMIRIECDENENNGYAEITIADNGRGMSEEQTAHLFDRKNVTDSDSMVEQSHGFGLQNCRGIIERYKKMSSVFAVCSIWVKSTVGEGTTIGFRLPLAVKKMLMMLIVLLHVVVCPAYSRSVDSRVSIFADSLYENNVNGHYDIAMQYADSCNAAINGGETVDSVTMLSIYNETAVAALALHDWKRYLLYNYRYNALYQEYTRDKVLPEYCESLENNKRVANIAMIVSLLMLIATLPIFWFVYMRYVMKERRDLMKRKEILSERIKVVGYEYSAAHVYNNITANQLSALKHETMYYPSRIVQMLRSGQTVDEVLSVMDYYRELYDSLCRQMSVGVAFSNLFPVRRCLLSSLIPLGRNDNSLFVVVNEELMSYLCQLLKQHNGGDDPVYTVHAVEEHYCCIWAQMPGLKLEHSAMTNLFSSATLDADYLVMRQILRETGEASLRYNCGICVLQKEGQTVISFTLPISL